MSIVKIHLYRSQTEKQQKYLLTYVPEIHTTIGRFLDFAIKAFEIHQVTSDQLLVQNDGYILPHCLDASVIKQMQLLTVKVKTTNKILPNFWTAQKLDDSIQHKQNIFSPPILSHLESQHLEESQSTPKFSQDGLHKLNLDKKNSRDSKNHKQIHKSPKTKPTKNKKKVIEESDQSSESEKQKVKKSKKPAKNKKKVVQQIESPSSEQEEMKKPKMLSKLKNKNQSFAKYFSSSSESEQEENSQSSEEESSEQELPRVNRTKKAIIKEKVESKKIENKKPQKAIQKPKSNSSSPKESSQPKKTQKQTQKNYKDQKKVEMEVVSKLLPSKVTYGERKKIIEADDIESSDSSSEEQVPMKKMIAQTKSPKTVQAAQPRMLPPALRNKPQQLKSTFSHQSSLSLSSFKKQQQQKWISITKQIIEKYKKVHQQNCPPETPFSQANNLIRFKEIELDEERFVPKTSEWIEATVEKVESDGKLKLIKVTQFGREYRDRYETYEHNMVEFQVNRDLLTKQQRQVVLEVESKEQPSQICGSGIQSSSVPVIQNQGQQKESNDKNSIQKFICGQVNYYFCDKNYQFDLFMQMHANKHPQKYIPIRFMLNFPKIKKVLKDQHKLFQYLVEDDKKTDRNFEIDEEKKLIRKKKILITKQQNVSEENAEESVKKDKPQQVALYDN